MEEDHIEEATQPGQYLAYEREKKGFTIEDIAGKLHLSPQVIRALEEEAYDKLPELVYVRGYIRSYCRLLSIDPIPVLDMYTANLPREEVQLLEDLSPSSPVNENQQRLIMIWGSVAVVSILFILIMSWWQEDQPIAISLNEPPVLQEDTATQSNANDIDINEPPVLQEDTAIQSNANDIDINEPPVLQEDTAIQSNANDIDINESPVLQEDTAIQSNANDIDINEPPVLQEDTAIQSNANGIDIPDTLPEQEATQSIPGIETVPAKPIDLPLLEPTGIEIKEVDKESNAADEGNRPEQFDTEADTEFGNQQADEIGNISQPVTLVVMSSGESWARVRDGGGEIFIHRILPADYNKIFMVNLPLKFELGNASQVSIMIEGKDYDFSSQIRPSRAATFEVTELP